jgi:hypothetical protein
MDCFVPASKDQVKRAAAILNILEIEISPDDRYEPLITDEGWAEFWRQNGLNLLKRGDRIILIDDCKPIDWFLIEGTSFNASPLAEKGYITKMDLLLTGPLTEIKKHIKKIELLRNGKRFIMHM